ncbi:MAG: DUF4328 domain-containing protein [Planctomycetes bacterium]|nr:DUF4328 domain-containing protein [Planctomycetota bacterium]
MTEEVHRDGDPLPGSAGDPDGAPLPAGPRASAEPAPEALPISAEAGIRQDDGAVGIPSADAATTVAGGHRSISFDDGQGANATSFAGLEQLDVGPASASLADRPVDHGGGRETIGVQRPPIRPAGFVSPAKTAVALVVVTLVQIAWFGFAVYYFLGLARHDWVEQLNPFDDHNVAAMSEHEWLLELDIPELAEERALYEAALARRAKFEQFERDQKWLLRTFIGLYWLELIAFCRWQLRVHRNVPALGTSGMRGEPLTSLVWWIVPIVNWWLPLSVMQEIWRGSDPSVPVGDGQAWRLKRGSALAGAWRAAAVLAKLTFGFCLFMLALRLYSVANPPLLLVVASALMIIAGALQIGLVCKLGARQKTLYRKRMRAAEKALAAGLPVVEAQVLDDE